jgi:apolipoprotein D and lipocalin family protein
MGRWYVIATIPTRLERGAVDSTECYAPAPDGTIKTTFRYRDGTDPTAKTLTARGFVREGSANAVWGMQFVWPIKAQYVIAWVDPDYQTTIVARDKRDYVWIMARGPEVTTAQYTSLVQRITQMGYDPHALVRVPHPTAFARTNAQALSMAGCQ